MSINKWLNVDENKNADDDACMVRVVVVGWLLWTVYFDKLNNFYWMEIVAIDNVHNLLIIHTLYYLLTYSLACFNANTNIQHYNTYRSFINGKYLLYSIVEHFMDASRVVDRWLYPHYNIRIHLFQIYIPLSSPSHVTQFIQ